MPVNLPVERTGFYCPVDTLQLSVLVLLLGMLNVWGMLGSMASIFNRRPAKLDQDAHELTGLEKVFYVVCVAVFALATFIDSLTWLSKMGRTYT